MTPSQLIPILEGLVGRAPQMPQIAQDWVKAVRDLLHTNSFRDLTDFQFTVLDDVIDVGVVVSASATHCIAALWEVRADLGTDTAAYVGFSDADSDTVDITSALSVQEDLFGIISVRDLAVSTVAEFYPIIFFAGAEGPEASIASYAKTGVALSVGLTAWADGKDGNAPAADTIRCYVVYRT